MGKKKSKGAASKTSSNNNMATTAGADDEPEVATQAEEEPQKVENDVTLTVAPEPVTDTAPIAPVVNVCYIEVNAASLSNVGDYVLESNGQNVFNIGIIFAANINYDAAAKKAVLFYNDHVTDCLNSGSIKQLQDKGIKVLLSILGNHAGVGVCNFPDQAAATAFAQEVANAVQKYNLDGVDIDDEYADYNPAPNDFSFVYFVQALRSALPADKLITFYFYGEARYRQSYNGVEVGTFLTYSWNATYGSFEAPNVPGLTKKSLSAAAVQVNQTSVDDIARLAKDTMDQQYGVFLCYNLPDATEGADYTAQLSAATKALYGSGAKFTGFVRPKKTAPALTAEEVPHYMPVSVALVDGPTGTDATLDVVKPGDDSSPTPTADTTVSALSDDQAKGRTAADALDKPPAVAAVPGAGEGKKDHEKYCGIDLTCHTCIVS